MQTKPWVDFGRAQSISYTSGSLAGIAYPDGSYAVWRPGADEPEVRDQVRHVPGGGPPIETAKCLVEHILRMWELEHPAAAMTFGDFHNLAMRTFSPGESWKDDVVHMSAGLFEEAGEVSGKLKRLYRGDYTNEEFKAAALKELGDVLWYADILAHVLGSDLETVAKEVAAKLADRQARGVLKGSGDNR
ncbi:MAG: nucleoside triphosphate pyrophosphohydrolase family protein [Novosphingobium sp.]